MNPTNWSYIIKTIENDDFNFIENFLPELDNANIASSVIAEEINKANKKNINTSEAIEYFSNSPYINIKLFNNLISNF